MTIIHGTKFLNAAEAAHYLNEKAQTLKVWCMENRGPDGIMVGDSRRSRMLYSVESLMLFQKTRVWRSTSEEAAARLKVKDTK